LGEITSKNIKKKKKEKKKKTKKIENQIHVENVS
jgi:hypothetical protein